MMDTHRITNADTWFLEKHFLDPCTKDVLKINDIIVICSECKTPQLKDTWELRNICSVCKNKNILIFSYFSPKLIELNINQKEWFNPIIERELPALADTVADYSADMQINTSNIFIKD